MRNLLDDGINFFNAGRYFEAHEAWEEMWRAETGRLRLFVQGLVQAAVGLYHFSRGNADGARMQLRKSIQKLDQYASDEAAIDVGRLREDLRQVLDRPELPDKTAIRIIRLQRKPVVLQSGDAS